MVKSDHFCSCRTIELVAVMRYAWPTQFRPRRLTGSGQGQQRRCCEVCATSALNSPSGTRDLRRDFGLLPRADIGRSRWQNFLLTNADDAVFEREPPKALRLVRATIRRDLPVLARSRCALPNPASNKASPGVCAAPAHRPCASGLTRRSYRAVASS